MTTQIKNPEGRPAVVWNELVQEALREVCDVMLGMKVSRSENPEVVADVTAIVGLAGTICGLLIICCNRDAAAKIAGKMLGTEVNSRDPHVLDALGEICNMVAGSFKSRVPGGAEGCMLSIPTTVVGGDYTVNPLRGGERYELLARCDDSPVQLILHVHV